MEMTRVKAVVSYDGTTFRRLSVTTGYANGTVGN